MPTGVDKVRLSSNHVCIQVIESRLYGHFSAPFAVECARIRVLVAKKFTIVDEREDVTDSRV